MKMVYQLHQPADCEGRTSHIVGQFTSEALAEAVGKTGFGNHSMGPSDGRVTALIVFDSLHEFLAANRDAPDIERVIEIAPDPDAVRRGRALAKLSDEERELLGL
jgi:hypothetical protein